MTDKTLGRTATRKTNGNSFFSLAIVTALLLGNCGCRSSWHHGEKDAGIAIVKQPKSQLAQVGKETEFESDAAPQIGVRPSFQWFFNGSPIEPSIAKELGITGATERKLKISSVATRHVGFYFCVIAFGSEVVVTEPAELTAFHHSVLTVYGTPISGSGSSGANNCPPRYRSYLCFRKPATPFGWRLTNPNIEGRASDPNRTNTTVRYYGAALAKNGCGLQSVRVPTGTDAYRFTIYFPDTPPPGAYSIQLDGFEQ